MIKLGGRRCKHQGGSDWQLWFGGLVILLFSFTLSVAKAAEFLNLPESSGEVQFLSHLGGEPADLVECGQYLYYAAGPGITVFEISDPADPVEVAQVILPSRIVSMAMDETGHRLFVLGVGGPVSELPVGSKLYTGYLMIIDVSDPAAPALIHREKIHDLGANTLQIHGQYLYVLAGGFRVWDIAGPEPFEIGSISLSAESMRIQSHTAFLYDLSELAVVDLSHPTTPTPLSSVDLNVDGVISHFNFDVDDNLISAHQRLFDASDPTSLTTLSNHDSGYLSALTTETLFTINHRLSADQKMYLRVWDIQNPSSPVLTESYELEDEYAAYTLDLKRFGHHLYLLRHDGFQIYDIRQPIATGPVLDFKQPVAGELEQVEVRGELAYTFDENNMLSAIDISDPTNPVLRSAVPVNYVYARFYLDGGHMVYLREEDHIRVMDYQNPDQPTTVTRYTRSDRVGSVEVINDGLLAINASGSISLVDVTAPTSPTTLGSYPGSHWMAYHEPHLYLYGRTTADAPWQLRQVDISNPTSPTTAQVISPSDPTEFLTRAGMEFVGDILVAVGSKQTYLIDFSEAFNPVIHELSFSGEIGGLLSSPYGLATTPTKAIFAVDSPGGAVVVDVTDPGDPKIDLIYFVPWTVSKSVAMQGDLLLLGNHELGLSILQFPAMTNRLIDYLLGRVNLAAEEDYDFNNDGVVDIGDLTKHVGERH